MASRLTVIPRALTDQLGNLINSTNRLPVDGGGGTAGSPSGGVQTVQRPEDGVALTKAAVTQTGASIALVATNVLRTIVMVSNADTNATAAVDPTGGTAALNAGIPLLGGVTRWWTGKMAQSPMTTIGTSGQLLTVYTG